MEQIPESSNEVTIDRAYRDQIGAFRPVIRYDLPDYVRSGFAMAKEASDAMYALLGVPPLRPDADRDAFGYPGDYTSYQPTDPGYVTYGDTGYTFQGAGHLAGTHRMGTSPRTPVVDHDPRVPVRPVLDRAGRQHRGLRGHPVRRARRDAAHGAGRERAERRRRRAVDRAGGGDTDDVRAEVPGHGAAQHALTAPAGPHARPGLPAPRPARRRQSCAAA